MRRIHVERRSIDTAAEPPSLAQEIANAFVVSLGWRAPRMWTEVDREGAIEVVSSALMNDLVDDAPRLPFRDAEERAQVFIAGCPTDAVFLTNGALEDTRMGFGRRRITQGKADTGVIAVSAERIDMLWVED